MNLTITKPTIVAALAVVALSGQPRAAEAGTWNVGDVFAGVGGGIYQVYDNAGNFKETIIDGLGGFTTGCACDPGLTKLYTTNFSNTKVVVYDKAHPHPISLVVDTNVTSPAGHSESLVFAANGDFYVGHPDGNDLIHHYTGGGALITTFNVVALGGGIDARGTDWIDLTGDQQILFYTSEGRDIQRIDTDEDGAHAVPVGLPIFATLPGAGNAFALRLLPPCDGSGGLLVADNGNVKHLDGTGAVFATYDVTGVNGWFSLNLDPDGVHFWAGSFGNRKFYKFAISAVAGNFVDTQVVTVDTTLNPNGGSLFGLCLVGEITCGTCEPVEDPDVRTQGFWKRVCAGPHPSGEHENLPDYVDCVNDTATFADVDDVDALCDRLRPSPPNDKCEQAEAQFMALLLNICSGRVAVCNCLDDPDFDTVGEAADFIDELLSNPDRTFDDCVLAQAIADDINNGVSLVDCP